MKNIIFLYIFTFGFYVSYSNICSANQLDEDIFHELLSKMKSESSDEISNSILFDQSKIYNNLYYLEIESYKIHCIPYLLNEYKKEGHNIYGSVYFYSIRKITKMISPEKHRKLTNTNAKNNRRIIFEEIVNWWENDGFKDDQKRFEVLYTQLKRIDSNEEKEKILYEIKYIGVAALENAIQKINEGDVELYEIVNFWADEEIFQNQEQELRSLNLEQKKTKVINWWEENKEKWTFPETNKTSTAIE